MPGRKRQKIKRPVESEHTHQTETALNRLPPSRQGKKAITAYVDPETHKQLRILGLDLDKSSQDIIIEALEDYFERHGMAD